jgi:acyl-CoA synthetase (AMP-forming)/AMP-acid ligase II
MNIASLLQAQAEKRPEAIAIITTQQGTDRRYSFARLADHAARSAALLHEKGIGKGDRVLVFQPMSYELYVVLLAIFRLGAVGMFLDPSAGRAHIEQCCDIGMPTALIASPRAHLLRFVSSRLRRIPTKFVVGGYIPGAISFRRADLHQPFDQITTCAMEAPALLTFTSGSTGNPKAALRSHGFLLAQHQTLAGTLKLKSGEVDLTTLPVFLLANLASGLTSVIPHADLRFPGRIAARPVVEQIERLAVTRSAGSPAFYHRVLAYCETKGRRLGGLHRIDTGGAPVFPRLLERLQQVAPEARIVAVYGSTEAEPMTHVAWTDIGDDELNAMRSGKGLLVGLPVTAVSLRIIPDRFGTPIGPFTQDEFTARWLPVGEIGEIVVTGDHVLKGYLHREGDTETKFMVEAACWHRTGDAGYLDARGRLWLVGRSSARIEDDKGVLYPFNVECAAQFIQGIQHSAMVSHEGRRILLVEKDSPLDTDSIAKGLAWAEVDEVRIVKQIPLDKRHNAKVDYPKLQKLLHQVMHQ